MGVGERNLPSEQSLIRGVVTDFIEEIRKQDIKICDEVRFRESVTPEMILILNSPRKDRLPGSNTDAEKDYRKLLAVRAVVGFKYGSWDELRTRILYSIKIISAADAGQEKIDARTEGFERIPINA